MHWSILPIFIFYRACAPYLSNPSHCHDLLETKYRTTKLVDWSMLLTILVNYVIVSLSNFIRIIRSKLWNLNLKNLPQFYNLPMYCILYKLCLDPVDSNFRRTVYTEHICCGDKVKRHEFSFCMK